MEKDRRNESIRAEKSRERMEMTGDEIKKKRGEQTESDREKKVFYLWRIWAYCLILQEYGGKEDQYRCLQINLKF